MAASLELQQQRIRPGRPEPLFKLSIPQVSPSADGKRFLVLEPEGAPAPDRPLVVMLNWAARLAK